MAGAAEIHHARIAAAMATAAGQWGERIGRQIANRAKEQCPVDEGRLRSSITHLVTVNPGGSVTVRVGSPLAYARYRHEGTGLYGPHHARIVPVTAQALKFRQPRIVGPFQPGARQLPVNRRPFVFARSVRGSVGYPFLTLALEETFGAANVIRNPTTS
ncbi:HK97 gp10 family phage protein [Nocardia amamiensis]|uniref:HK97 gp10 family phage protein n=1 Tax=Nocardia amamiensis TaxID=404578 RepID=A0ABS0CNT0_9NOCA|nr:HK97 gp10 family phage protein [Nocardia amamiensis]MBF6298215.1 HK97 gp10 family phage protein [Nocardia amamiensis]